MKKIALLTVGLLIGLMVHAESARSILDKAAATVSNPGGVQVNFEMLSKQFGNTSGSISIKGRKFHATTPQATIWFDGKTQWTYMKQNDEVNVSNPTEEELQAINPYNFINIYKKGFKMSSKKVNNSFEVHLKATDKKRKIQEMYIIVDQKSYRPTHVKMQQNGKWSTLIISNLKTTSLGDDLFQFNAKDFPQAEIIDLR
jgi:outer membrane lipoprotein-sorting protein